MKRIREFADCQGIDLRFLPHVFEMFRITLCLVNFAFQPGGFIIRLMAAKSKRKLTENNQLPGVDHEVMLSDSDPEAKQLYDLAIQVKKLAPWQWMEETDV